MLTVLKIISNPNKVKLTVNMILIVEIISVKNNSYLQRLKSNLFNIVVHSKVIKID